MMAQERLHLHATELHIEVGQVELDAPSCEAIDFAMLAAERRERDWETLQQQQQQAEQKGQQQVRAAEDTLGQAAVEVRRVQAAASSSGDVFFPQRAAS